MKASVKRSLGLAVLLLLLVLLAWGLWQATRPQPEVLQGQMEARETDIAGKVTARVQDVLVQEGDHIEAGALLVRLDSPEVRAKLAQASAAEEAAQAVVDKAESGARPQEVEMARLQWQRAQTAAELALSSRDRVASLAQQGLVAEQKRDEAEANWKAARDAERAARAQYDLAREGARQEDQAAASAQARQVAAVTAEVEAALAETELRSPVAGEVAQVLVKAGELWPQGVAMVTVVDLQDQWVVLNVREDQLAAFAPDQEFDARLPALAAPGQAAPTVRFRVYHNAVLPDFATWRATRSGAGFDVRTFEVRARPLQAIAGARPGMSVLVDAAPARP